MQNDFIGIDYGSKLAGTSVIAFLNSKGQIEFAQSQKKQDADAMIVDWIKTNHPSQVFIDAPLSLPLVYLDKQRAGDYFYRKADKEIKAMSPMFLGGLTARAMRLKNLLEEEVGLIQEVYPGGLARHLELPKQAYKKEKTHLEPLSQSICQKFNVLLHSSVQNWHQFDALLAYCIGIRYNNGENLKFGDPQEGLIIV